MNILSISQIQTQAAQTDFGQVLSSNQPKSEESHEKSSFAKALEDAKKSSEPEKAEERIPADENTKISQKDEKVESDSNKKTDTPKDEKIAKRNEESVDEDKKFVVVEDDAEIAENFQNVNNFVQIVTQNHEDGEKNLPDETQNLVIDTENSEINNKMLSWLMSNSKIEEKGEEISDDDFAQMIDAAVEFIPGFESESEKLESAQNLAASDPKMFLETVEFEPAQLARGVAKSELISDSDKKIASPKEKKNDAKISVHDLRTHHFFDEDSAKIASDKIVQKSAEKKEINLSLQKQADGNVQMTMELAARAEQNITSSSSQAAGATGSDFQQMLSNAVQENAPDFVKAGNIVLKDNNQGSINLILRPEGLGNVKISLNLDDKNLSAQITVQTKEAMDAFRESIPSLKQAFTESGFETGSFDLNFSNNQQNFAQSGNDGQNQQNASIVAQKTYNDFVTHASFAETGEAYSDGDYSVNIVA